MSGHIRPLWAVLDLLRRAVCITPTTTGAPGFANLIVTTEQIGPAEPFFQAYGVLIEEMNSRNERRCSSLLEGTMEI